MSTAKSRLYNFVNDKAASTPITASRVDGELDQIITALNQKVIIAASAPSSPIAGMLWYDSTNKLLKQYRNSEWVVMGAVHVGTAAPTTCQEGDIFFNSTTHKLYVYSTSTAFAEILQSSNFGTLGQMLVSSGGAGTAPTSLGMGTLGNYLKSNGIGSAPSWQAISIGFGSAVVYSTSIGTAILAASDGIVNAFQEGSSYSQLFGSVGMNTATGTSKARNYSVVTAEPAYAHICFPVRSGEYWKVATDKPGTNYIEWNPMNA